MPTDDAAVPPDRPQPAEPAELAAAVKKWRQAKKHYDSLHARQRSAYDALHKAEAELMDIWLKGDAKKL